MQTRDKTDERAGFGLERRLTILMHEIKEVNRSAAARSRRKLLPKTREPKCPPLEKQQMHVNQWIKESGWSFRGKCVSLIR